MSQTDGPVDREGRLPAGERILAAVERIGNRLPDPALLFLLALLATWVASWLLAPVSFGAIDPRTKAPIAVKDLLTGAALTEFLSGMVRTFVTFPPLGVVLVAVIGVGVAEHTGFVRAALRAILSVTPSALLTPMLLFVAILSHVAVDVGYVLVIPLGAVIFEAAGRHPLAGIAAAFAGVSGGFSANPLPSSLDPMLQGFTQAAAQVVDPGLLVNPLCNWYFTAASSLLVVGIGWWVTDKIVEPRLASKPVDGDHAGTGRLEPLTRRERRGLAAAVAAVALGGALFAAAAWSGDSPLRGADGSLAQAAAPLMQSIAALIFLFAVLPGVFYGVVTGSVRSHRDIVAGMTAATSGMGSYIVMAFFAALFLDAFTRSNLGALLAVEGALGLQALALPGAATIAALIGLTATVNLVIGSASAKWGLLGPVFVPMLMQVGISPEFTQAAYRIGDSTTNIITPLMPYFPLVVVYCTRYCRDTRIGTLVGMMLPYSVTLLLGWSLFLLVYWGLGIPLGPGASYAYP